MSVLPEEVFDPWLLDAVVDDLDHDQGYCGLGVCAAEAGHQGTCDEASGWNEPVVIVGGTNSTWSITASSNQVQNYVWQAWTNSTSATQINYADSTGWITVQNNTWTSWNRNNVVPPARTPEEEAARVERRRLREQQRADREQAHREARARANLAAEQRREDKARAEERARELLSMVLPAAAFLEFENTGLIAVTGSEGGMYQIDSNYGGVHGNIVQVDEHGCRLARICVAPDMRLGEGHTIPLHDGYVGQYLAIKHDEGTFKREGNYSQKRPCRHAEPASAPLMPNRAVQFGIAA